MAPLWNRFGPTVEPFFQKKGKKWYHPLRSLINGPPIGVRFQESLVLDYTQKLTRSTLALKLSVSQPFYPFTQTQEVFNGKHVLSHKRLIGKYHLRVKGTTGVLDLLLQHPANIVENEW